MSEYQKETIPEASKLLETVVTKRKQFMSNILSAHLVADNVQIWTNLDGQLRRIEYLSGTGRIISDRGIDVDFRAGQSPTQGTL